MQVEVDGDRDVAWYQPAAFVLVVGPPVMTGAVRSILMPVTDAGSLVLPALSVMVTGPAPRLRALAGDRAVGGLGRRVDARQRVVADPGRR